MKECINIGLIGYGQRGTYLLRDTLLHRTDIHILAVCDAYEDRAIAAQQVIAEEKGYTPFATVNYKEILAMQQVGAVLVTSSWAGHIQIAIDAMEAGKYVGIEVGGAYSVDECWQLVHAYERTKIPCMMMENCCYGRNELLILNMVRQGLFGEVVHCQGGYKHDLRDEISKGEELRHYRLSNYKNRNCENYPTHELGPISRVLNINRGNRLVSLSSFASKAAGLHDYLVRKNESESDPDKLQFTQGDVVTTVLKCAHGETITLTLDTTLPRPYSRGLHIQGTRGLYQEDNQSVFLDGTHNQFHEDWKGHWGNVEEYYAQYDHPIWKKYLEDGVMPGHGGMDWLVCNAFFDAVANGTNTPIDVYDIAVWMCVTPLSEAAIAMGGMPVAIPDFTNGRWINRKAEGDL